MLMGGSILGVAALVVSLPVALLQLTFFLTAGGGCIWLLIFVLMLSIFLCCVTCVGSFLLPAVLLSCISDCVTRLCLGQTREGGNPVLAYLAENLGTLLIIFDDD